MKVQQGQCASGTTCLSLFWYWMWVGTMKEEGYQGTNPISRLQTSFCSKHSFLTPDPRKETQLYKCFSQAIGVFVKRRNQTIPFYRRLCSKVTFLLETGPCLSQSCLFPTCDHCRGGRGVKVIQHLELHPRLHSLDRHHVEKWEDDRRLC